MGRRPRSPEQTNCTRLKSVAEIGDRPACVHDCYNSTGSGYHLQRHDDVIGVTGSDVIVHDSFGSTVQGLDRKPSEAGLSAASQVLYQAYIGSVV